jgi:hypothetical protein
VFTFVAARVFQVGFVQRLCLLDEPVKKNHAFLYVDVKRTLAMRVGRVVLTSNRPPPSGRHTGMPIGQPNSTVLISAPINFFSIVDNDFNQSLTGSRPASVR